VFVVAAKRTASGKYGGKLRGLTATDLGLVAAKAAMEAGRVNPELVNSIVFGNVQQVRTHARTDELTHTRMYRIN
jgi:acetyl-CoA acetyltransferase